MSNSCKVGAVYFQEEKALHLAEFSTIENNPCIDSKRSRWAFIIINKKEVKNLCPNETDKQIILDTIKNEYSSYLTDAIKKESLINNQALLYSQIKGSKEIEIKNKLVKLQSSNIYGSKSYGTVLKDKNYIFEYNNNLTKEQKTKDKDKTTSTLDYTKQICQKVLDKEKYLNKSVITKGENSSYVIVSMPYVYNYKKNSSTELEAILYEDRISASYMPELIVEYGVFYDGTNNNMYNIDFYRNYKKFLDVPCKFIVNSKDEPVTIKENITEYVSIQEYIAAEPNPKKEKIIMDLLHKQIIDSNIRYFDKYSKEFEGYDDSSFFQTKISNHAEKVFEYLVDVKKDDEDKKASNSEQNKFLYKHILPTEGDGSYTNGETNISRLYKLYNADDLKTFSDVPATTRFKVYASGSGTNDVFEKEDYENDSIIGLGLGIGDTGVKAHIIYTCIKIAEQFRKSSIFNIDELILDTFGFSRGATSARHFVCSIIDEYVLTSDSKKRKYTLDTKDKKDIFSVFFEKDDGVYTRVGNKIYFNPLRVDIEKITIKNKDRKKIIKNPYYNEEKINIESLSFRFVGIYDTVTHYGVKQSNDHEDLNIDFGKDQNSKKLGHVTHYMAENEYRYNFEAYSIFDNHYNTKYKMNNDANFEEFIIPGAHADVGGGYNIGNELIFLGFFRSESSLKNKISLWNNKYKWVESSKVIKINNKSFLRKKDLEDNDDGFYFVEISGHSTLNSQKKYKVYMYKKTIFNKYEHVSLKLLYDKAINNKENLEKTPIKNPNKDYSFSGLLKNVYNKLINLQDIDKEDYKNLKDDYLHHSSKIADFVNKPSMDFKSTSDFYGKRIVYGAKGENFTLNKERI